MKSTKNKLLSSIATLCVCFAMLIGSTYAWFTDTASTGVNKIQAGNLDVELLDESGTSVEGQKLKWKTQDNRDQNEILWEPGCTYELQPVVIKNNGNLALKYKIVITGINGTAKLNEVIEWTIEADNNAFDFGEYHSLGVNASNRLTISGHMKDDANNDYKNLSIDGIGITVVATQDTVEFDSTDNNYDASANEFSVWDGSVDTEGLVANTDDVSKTVAIKTAAQFAAFEKAVNGGNSYSGYTINLLTPIDLNNNEWAPIGQTGAGNTTFSGTFDGHGLTIKNLKIADDVSIKSHGTGLFGWLNTAIVKNVTVDTASVSGHSYTGVIAGYVESIPTSLILNCHVTNATISSTSVSNNGGDDGNGDGAKVGGIAGFALNEGTLVKDCTVSHSTIAARRDAGQVVGIAPTANVENCSATSVSVTPNNTGANDEESGTHIRNEVIGRLG